jgi:hypothetical protein
VGTSSSPPLRQRRCGGPAERSDRPPVTLAAVCGRMQQTGHRPRRLLKTRTACVIRSFQLLLAPISEQDDARVGAERVLIRLEAVLYDAFAQS